ncbi:MAG TPA: CCA tRNA nucleotidyltransferase [Bacteroidetes bacterium]|nr:CCA tRNA nucleotidyltransferase [Candidatus Limimorpha avicola]
MMNDLSEYINSKIFRLICKASHELGYKTYVIGGYVRDIFLQRKSDDIDIVTIGSGIELAKKVAALLKEKREVKYYGRFGTAMIRVNNVILEFVGARKESYDPSSRKPTVENGTLEDDLNRRDFTINALSISLNEDSYGELLDPFNGLQDLHDRIIRTPLDADITYSDDPLRMLRAIRFATQLHFKIEDASFEAIRRNAGRIKIISKERITEELNKILMSKMPSIGFRLLDKSGLLSIIFPQLYNLKGIDIQDGRGHKDNFYHTLEVLDNVAQNSDNLWLRWTALLHDIAKPQTKRYDKETGWSFHGHEVKGAKMVPKIFADFHLPMNEKMRYVQKLVMLHLRPIVLAQDIVTDSAVRRLLFDAGDDIDDLMILCNADITSKNEEKKNKYHNNFLLVRQKLKEIEEKDHLRNWQPPVNGEMIMETFNIGQCINVGKIKNAIRDAILDGVIKNNFEEAYAFMKAEGLKLGLTVVNELTEHIDIKSNGPVPKKI